ncbi:MAG: pyrimidine/purine nucleoside phosphorylase [bacterium]|nr:pyrimidine/purine nucleoside phosphorylase [bacterium]
MATPESQPDLEALTHERPDNVYFDSNVVSWEYRTPDGTRATLGVIQPGFNEVFPVSEGGENIRLHQPDGTRSLTVQELEDGEPTDEHVLTGDEEVRIPGGIDIRVTTPVDQGPIAYVCEYPES